MVRFLSLIVMIALLAPAAVYGQDSCHAAFVSPSPKAAASSVARSRPVRPYEARVTAVDRALKGKYGVKIEPASAVLNAKGVGADVHRETRVLRFNELGPALDQFVSRFHESVHVATVHRVETKPDDPQNALAILVARDDEGKISIELPEGYEGYFSLDEMKAYDREAGLIEQLARTDETVEPNDARELAMELRQHSFKFAREAEKILMDAKSVMVRHLALHNQGVSAQMYNEKRKDMFLVIVEIPQPGGGTIDVGFPITAPKAARSGTLYGFEEKVIALCDSGIGLARDYERKQRAHGVK